MKIKNLMILILILVIGVAFNVSAKDPQKMAENLMAGNPILAGHHYEARFYNNTLNLAVGLGKESPSFDFISQMAITAWEVRTAYPETFNNTNLYMYTPAVLLPPIRIAWVAVDPKQIEPIVMPVLQHNMGFVRSK
jgi:hypothetical protein